MSGDARTAAEQALVTASAVLAAAAVAARVMTTRRGARRGPADVTGARTDDPRP
ncbi:hypothetical protein [Streptomyces triticiradicis]|uniref:hypothetical protein n=1 Tax=Streptomyces triticiradicis TaxID=2651189 RepID=UPI001CEC542F|nr:hypothetical protein [Streptomyces triticiradicis]